MDVDQDAQVTRIETLFQQLNWQGRHQFARRLERHGLTVTQYQTLAGVRRFGPEAGMGELSDALQLARSTVTSIMDRLVELGLVERRNPEGDRRAVVATLTDSGEALIATVEAAKHADLARMLEGLPAADLDRFAEMLSYLLKALDQLETPVEAGAGGREGP